ncbi:MAG: isoprenylcysteine carboxylmethyltransferase family protein [Candidatus Marinimicrobia bacterium]|nr:isoprenylcysteine carboxylmethyltransferase family protein [Candidatus Neomarinimicrobiota bacterium]
MIEKVYLELMLFLFILAFVIKTLQTWLSTKQRIRGHSKKISITVSVSAIMYFLIFSRLFFWGPGEFLEVPVPGQVLKNTGLVLVTVGFILGILAFISIKNSWRIAIHRNQKTKLITKGIYKISRNPYFLSYDIFFLGYIFYFPSVILISLYILLVIVIHRIILDEERYLESVHGTSYLAYKSNVNRYLTFKWKTFPGAQPSE